MVLDSVLGHPGSLVASPKARNIVLVADLFEFLFAKKGGVLLTVGEIKEKKEKGKEGEGEKRESVEEMALI